MYKIEFNNVLCAAKIKQYAERDNLKAQKIDSQHNMVISTMNTLLFYSRFLLSLRKAGYGKVKFC